MPDAKIENAVREVFGLRPAQIIKQLNLLRPIYEETSAYGHFGRTQDLDVFTWERNGSRGRAARRGLTAGGCFSQDHGPPGSARPVPFRASPSEAEITPPAQAFQGPAVGRAEADVDHGLPRRP